jgi:hypothetical protein
MRSIVLATVAVLAFGTAAGAAPASVQGPYHLDAQGKCLGGSGQVVPANMCSGPTVNPYCKQGVTKPCGKTCIAVGKVCHVGGGGSAAHSSTVGTAH